MGKGNCDSSGGSGERLYRDSGAAGAGDRFESGRDREASVPAGELSAAVQAGVGAAFEARGVSGKTAPYGRGSVRMMRFRQDDAFQSRDQRERFFLSLRDGPAAFDWE